MLKPVKGADLADICERQKPCHEKAHSQCLWQHMAWKVTTAFQTLDCQLTAERHSLSKASREWNVMIPPAYPFLCPADHRTAKPGSCHYWQEPVQHKLWAWSLISSHLLTQGDGSWSQILLYIHINSVLGLLLFPFFLCMDQRFRCCIKNKLVFYSLFG